MTILSLVVISGMLVWYVRERIRLARERRDFDQSRRPGQ